MKSMACVRSCSAQWRSARARTSETFSTLRFMHSASSHITFNLSNAYCNNTQQYTVPKPETQTYMLSDDLPIFDELCRRSLMFIYKCFLHSSSPVKFVTRYAVMFARHKLRLGGNSLLCVSRFRFSKSAFLNGSININYVIRHHCLSVTDFTLLSTVAT